MCLFSYHCFIPRFGEVFQSRRILIDLDWELLAPNLSSFCSQCTRHEQWTLLSCVESFDLLYSSSYQSQGYHPKRFNTFILMNRPQKLIKSCTFLLVDPRQYDGSISLHFLFTLKCTYPYWRSLLLVYRLSCEINCKTGSQVFHFFTISMRRGEKNCIF